MNQGRRVVVTGIGVVTPVGNDRESFWRSLTEGRSGIGRITRFDTTDFKVKIAAEVKNFDPLLYMDKGEARRQDRFSQYAIAAAEEAMLDSGLVSGAGRSAETGAASNIDPERLGVYIGSGTGGMETFMEEAKKLLENGPRKVSPFFVPMMIANMAAGNTAIRFGAKGPSLPVVTACATSTNAIGEAFRAIRGGYADAIIAGGTESAILPLSIAGFTNCMALTLRNDPESASIPFDRRRDGFVMGEGAGVLILEEYEHAKARGASVYAEVAGYGNTCDAYHMTAPDPDGSCAARAIRMALEEADAFSVPPEYIYLNAHGTSTPLNDKTETRAIKLAFGETAARNLHISSTKSMTGHMLGAAGAIEAAAAVLALRDGIVPPTIGYREKDPECDLNITPNVRTEAELLVGLSTSLGFGGHDACIAFRKSPEAFRDAEKMRSEK